MIPIESRDEVLQDLNLKGPQLSSNEFHLIFFVIVDPTELIERISVPSIFFGQNFAHLPII